MAIVAGAYHRRMDDQESEWQRKGATLSEKTAQKEFGLAPDEIAQAMRVGKLQYRHTSLYGNPSVRLLRREVEALVQEQHGDEYLKDQKVRTEIAQINREINRLKALIVGLEEKKRRLNIQGER